MPEDPRITHRPKPNGFEVEIVAKRSVEIPTDRGKKLKLERDGDQVKITYTGIRTPVVDLEHLQRAVRELGD